MTTSSESGGSARKGAARNVVARHARTSASAVGCASSAALTYSRSPRATSSISSASSENSATARPSRIAAAAASLAAAETRGGASSAAAVKMESVSMVDARVFFVALLVALF